MSRSRYEYSPALDGIRGTAMVAFMAFHFGAGVIQGAWVGINLFFVLSGFLIVRLLVEEHHRYGSIDAVGFYKRRVRRLIPALVALLLAVVAHGYLFGPEGQLRRLGWDVLATLGYVMNWRLLATDDAYFNTFDSPSPLRHAWTLSIEEQFYVLVPFVIGGLLLLVRRRWTRVAILVALAGVCAVWTAVLGLHDPTTDHARVYYGTDVRAQSLFIGAALGIALAVTPRGRRYYPLSAGTTHALGWVALAATVVGFLAIDPFAGWMFNGGGMLLSSVVFAVLVMACQESQPTALTRLLGWAPFAHLGRLSYGLYLWHWPVHVWLGPDRIAGSTLLTGAVGMVITGVIAHLSWTYLERPVVKHGMRGLLPSLPPYRTTLAAVVPVALVAVLGLSMVRTSIEDSRDPGTAAGGQAFDPAGLGAEPGPVQDLLEGQDEYTDQPQRIGLYGDSVPHLLLKGFPKGEYPGITFTDATVPGCDFLDLPVRWSDDLTEAPNDACSQVHRDFATLLEADKAQVLMIFASPLMLAPHELPDGTVVTYDSPKARQLILDRLDTIRREAKAAGVRQLQLVNVPCRELPAQLPGGVQWQIFTRQPELRQEWEDPSLLNGIIEEWADKHPSDTAVIDLDSALCADGFEAEVNGEPLYADIVHFSPRSTPMLWTWLTGQSSTLYADRPKGRS